MADFPSPHSPRLWPGLTAGLLALALAGGVFYRTWEATQVQSMVARATAGDEDAARELEARVARFLDDDARPLLRTTREKDLAAVKKAVALLDARFAAYASGIGGFTHDLTGWGTRFKLIWRKGVETAERKAEHSWTAGLVQEKFAKHVVSDARLEADVMEVVSQFAYELEANRNELLGNLRTRLTASALPVHVQALALEEFQVRFDSELKTLLKVLPGQSVAVGVGSLTAGIVAEEAVRQLVRVVIAQAATRLAAGAAASGGAAATAVTAGGAGGTALAPGVGTVIGVAGGFLVGAIVDWWMTDKFEAEVKAQCLTFLQNTRASLVGGSGGLEALLTAQVDRTSRAWEKAVTGTLEEAAREP